MPAMQNDLFAAHAANQVQQFGDGFVCLRSRAQTASLMRHIERLTQIAPFRHMTVPGGGRMAVAMSNCGALGWVADRQGYRYSSLDPLSGRPWPAMPDEFLNLAHHAAAEAGFAHFEPDACLINRYVAGAGLGVHRDQDEANLGQPIVSVSLGASATFLWGGLRRRDPLSRLPVHDGDVLVWGGAARLTYHGVLPLAPAEPGALRFNLTFRCAAEPKKRLQAEDKVCKR
jgi:alkylated DNA repair protein (DNA oxidative demethylase)